MKKLFVITLLLLCVFLLSCSEKLVRVKPYEREYFAQDKMFYSPMETRTDFEEHIFSIREGTVGGTVTFQGGCGCR